MQAPFCGVLCTIEKEPTQPSCSLVSTLPFMPNLLQDLNHRNNPLTLLDQLINH